MITSIENIWVRGSFLALALALGACGDDDGGGDDDKPDTGTPAGDASTRDAAVPGLDATVDAGPKADASTPTDSGARDAASTTPDATVLDAGGDAAIDSGAAAVIPTLNGCTPEMYVDQSTTGTRTVVFGGGTGLAYSPKCLTIAAGQKVTFSGTFTQHPLAKGTPTDANAGSANSPISNGTGTSKEITFATAGTYPYYCTIHTPGMVGSIHVK